MENICPWCGQKILIRFGVRFQPKKADLIDMIQSVTDGRGGVSAETLAWVFYPGIDTTKAKQRVKVLISQVNNELVGTDRRIRNGYGLYKLS